MNCKEFESLTIVEKIELVGKLVHLVQTNSDAFNDACKLLYWGEKQGYFDNIKINPNEIEGQVIPPISNQNQNY